MTPFAHDVVGNMLSSGRHEHLAERICDQIDRVAARLPHKTAFCVGARSITYQGLCESADHLACGLLAAGIRKGDRIAVWLSNRIEWLQIFHAAARMGAVLVPLSTRFKAAEAAQLLRHSGAAMLIVNDRFAGVDFLALLEEIAPGLLQRGRSDSLPALRHLVLASASPSSVGRAIALQTLFDVPLTSELQSQLQSTRASIAPADPFLIQYTSGTTGLPKGAVLSQRNFALTGYLVGKAQGLTEDDRFFSPAPYFHVSGTMHAFVAPLAHGATVHSIERYDIETVLKTICDNRCTAYHGFNFFKDFFARRESLGERFDLSSLRRAWTTGTDVDLRRIESLGIQVCSLYGLSETTGCASLCVVDDPLDQRIASVGRPLPGVEVRIAARQPGGSSPGVGESGEIQLRGWNVMSHYHDMPEQTAAALDAEGWLRTGDLGALDQDGRLRFLGRIKELIRTGGENFSPLEVENLLRQHPEVADACVVGVADQRLGEVAFAMVQRRPGSQLASEALLEFCRGQIASYKLPRYVHFVDNFPMTGNNKIRRVEVRAMARALRGEEVTK